MACRWDAAPWTPRPAPAPVGSRSPTSLTVSGGNPSSTAPTLTLTFHPRVRPETPPQPVTCKFTPPHTPPQHTHTHLQTVDSMQASLPVNHFWRRFANCATVFGFSPSWNTLFSLKSSAFTFLLSFMWSFWERVCICEWEFFLEKITCLCNSHLKFYCLCFADEISKFSISKCAAAELEVSLVLNGCSRYKDERFIHKATRHYHIYSY